MSSTLIKSKIKKRGIKSLIVVAVLAGSAFGAHSYNVATIERLKGVESDVSKLGMEISKKRDEYRKSEESLKEYLAIDKTKLPSKNGYVLGRDRLRAAYALIQPVKDIYMFKKLNFTLTEIKPYLGFSSEIFSVYENNIIIDFAGATDEYIYSFISDVKNILPGFINLKSLDMKKNQEITVASINDYLSTGGAPFVSGKMELTWNTLKTPDATGAGGVRTIQRNVPSRSRGVGSNSR